MKCVIVPRSDLDEIEESRKLLWKVLRKELDPDLLLKIEGIITESITSVMYKVGNKIYQEMPSDGTYEIKRNR